MLRSTKIVATLGPASSEPAVLERMIRAGVDVVRLNFSHGTAEDHLKRAQLVKEVGRSVGRTVGIMADLQGPKIRVGKFADGKIMLEKGQKFVLDAQIEMGNAERSGLDYKELPRDVSAVSGACLGIRRELFAELGGFDQSFPAYYSDVDLCLRVRERGLRIVVDPRIELTYEDRGSGAGFADRRRLRERWGAVLAQGDPYYPEAFDRTVEDVRLNESG